jgi:hypothetical protein
MIDFCLFLLFEELTWFLTIMFFFNIQGFSEISTLILTGNKTHQKELLFSLPFWRRTLRSGLKK